MNRPMKILQINTADAGGGAEGSAVNLMRQFRSMGHESALAVGQKFTGDSSVFEMPRHASFPGNIVLALSNVLRPKNRDIKGIYPLTRMLDRIAMPHRLGQWLDGVDETGYAPFNQFSASMPFVPDVIHCHNLHGWYFDLEYLQQLSKLAPLIINMRDTWLLSGHCAYFLDCERWKVGCGQCSRLDLYPRCRKDRTADNLKRKAEILRNSNVKLTAPSRWLAGLVEQSVLSGIPCKVIPNGINTHVFKQEDQKAARKALELPLDSKIVLFAAAAAKSNFKDSETLWKAAEIISAKCENVRFICLGISAADNLPKGVNVKCLPFVENPQTMAQYYQAADMFMHAAKVEAFGKTVTESMACGTPVAATAVGGIPEQVVDGVTGYLSRPSDAVEMAENVLAHLAMNDEKCQQMRNNAAERGMQFSLERQATSFLDWYAELIEEFQCLKSVSAQ